MSNGGPRRPNLSSSTANLAINTCAGVVDPCGGPALSMPPAWNRQRQVAGLWNNAQFIADRLGIPTATADFLAGADPRIDILNGLSDLLWVSAQAPTWWTFNLYGLEVAQFLPIGVAPVEPISQSAFLNRAPSRFTRLKAVVEWENMQLPRSVMVDIGTGTRFSILANNVRVKLLVPTLENNRFLEEGSRPQNSTTTYTGGFFVNSLIGASGYPCFAPLCNRYPTFTQNVRQLGAAEGGVEVPIELPVPSGAKYITIYTDEAIGAAVPWFFQSTPIAEGGPPYTTINPDPTTNNVIRYPVPQNASTIVQPVAAIARRQWEIVWELEL